MMLKIHNKKKIIINISIESIFIISKLIKNLAKSKNNLKSKSKNNPQ